MQIYSNKLFKNPVEIIEIFHPNRIKSALNKIQTLQNQGFHLLGYMRYELKNHSKLPLLYFEAFKEASEFKPKILNEKVATIISPLITKKEYFEKISYIKEKIKNGYTYEVNFTYPLILQTNADDFDLYNYFLQKQTTPYNCFLQNKYETILSFSPELFFKLNDKNITTKPMKGTICRGKTKDDDEKLKQFLQNDIKNRAENIMIVDLLRNDLGKISKAGSVKVDNLFEIEEHETLFQMTSQISALLNDDISLFDIINAIYPCGSITGAPKISTMQIIKKIENHEREIYCGAIGYLHKNESIFSVPIRILQRKNDELYYKYFVGSGIVWDSSASKEWSETLLKAKFLQSDFTLIETLKDDFDLHIKRLKNSAKKLGFRWNKNIENLAINSNVVTRIELFKDGNFTLSTREIPTKIKNPKIKISHKVNSSNPFLYHKTSIRRPDPNGIFEELAINEKGELTEGVFTNIAIKLGENLYTPPVSCGLLNGILRDKLVKQGFLKEKILYENDLKQADKIYCLNSVRGMFEVWLDE